MALRILGFLSLKKVTLVVCDDADVVSTTHLVKSHLLLQLPANCQQILSSATLTYASTYHVKNPIKLKLLREDEMSSNIAQYYIECSDFIEKASYVRKITELVSKFGSNGKAIVFCNVRLFTNLFLIENFSEI